MSNNLYLDWAMTAVSIFNAILLLWLGLTVALNAEKRSWGVWLGSAGLLLGGLFFISHTVILALGPRNLSFASTVFWWTAGLIPAIVLPFGWYVIMLWYAGYWYTPPTSLRKRQRPYLILTITLLLAGLATLVLGIMLLIAPTNLFQQLRFFIRWSVAGIPLLMMAYSAYVILCIGLSLDALRRPAPSRRVMGDLARQRAHPWLVGATLAQIVVSLLVAGTLAWLMQDVQQQSFAELYEDTAVTLAWLDLFTELVISAAIIMLGQALVSYEVFTGQTLPRQGLRRHWYNTIVMGLFFAAIISGAITLALRPLYAVMLVALMVAVFYALFAWQSFAERERTMSQLRPFTTSARLYDQLITMPSPASPDTAVPFRALCRDILDASVGFLAALGPIAPLVGPPITYPETAEFSPTVLPSLRPRLTKGGLMIPVDPTVYGRATWAVPLWSERGLIGVCLLGEKLGGGLYTQEEIELARNTGERLIDSQASTAIAQRLMVLQRERLTQTQIIDQQTRRVLHDEILPSLQTAMIALSGQDTGPETAVSQTLHQLEDAHRQISDLLHQMPTTTAPEVPRLGLVKALRRTIALEFTQSFDEVCWQMSPAGEALARSLPPMTAEVIYYAAREAVRNAARYGRNPSGTAPFTLTVQVAAENGLQLVIKDNGVGVTAVTANKGSGQGLALHSTMMAVIGGALTIDSIPGTYTQVTLSLPSPTA